MSYQVLARKWRPQNFVQMVGQNHVLRALVNAIDREQLHHAYLFTGTRGVGKTTIARILAKCLNCESKITSTPCGTCSTCVDITAGKYADLLEVDAASRTKVEQTRELLDNVAYAPVRGRFKIYLIDEVHMLSTHSFNALLKTLEEPPSHVIFILATTDPERLPMTILSRCLHFHLKNMPAEMIANHLAHILTQEQISFTQDALMLLGQAAKGSMRDALSLLDQAIAYGAGCIETEAVRELLGCIDPKIILQILTALQQKNVQNLFATLNTESVSVDALNLLDELILALHQLALWQQIPSKTENPLYAFTQVFTPEEIQLFYQMAINGRRDLPWAANLRQGVEMVLLRMIAFYPLDAVSIKPKSEAVRPEAAKPEITKPEALKPQVMKPEAAKSEVTKPLAAKPETSKPLAAQTLASETVKPQFASEPGFAPKPALPLSGKTWMQIVPQLGLTGLSMALASHCILKAFDEAQIHLALAPAHAPLLNASSVKRIQDALNGYLNQMVTIKIHLEETGEETLALQQQRLQQQAQQTAVQSIQGNSQVQAMVQTLGASIINDSITAR